MLSHNQHVENKRFLPRTPLPADNTYHTNSSPESTMQDDRGTLQRGKQPPPPPQRISSHESGVILAMQGIVENMISSMNVLFDSSPHCAV